MVGCGTSHAINVTVGRFVVNIEMGAVCEYFHNARRERSLGALIQENEADAVFRFYCNSG